MSNILRSSLLLIAALSLAFGAAADEEAPLQLGNEHLGMTSETIAESERAAETERAVDRAIERSEWTDEDLAPAEFSCECPVCEGPAPAAGPAPIETHAVGVSDYESCIEVAIRAGNGFSAASSVCQALFPEPLEAEAPPDVDVVEPSEPAEADDDAQDLSATTTGY